MFFTILCYLFVITKMLCYTGYITGKLVIYKSEKELYYDARTIFSWFI